MIAAEDITIELRLATTSTNLKAFADVTVSLGESGIVAINGFSVVGNPPRVVPPARQGKQRFFDVVLLTGNVKTLVYTLIGMAYKKALSDGRAEVL